MLHYVTLGSNDLARSRVFYDAALKPLGIVCLAARDAELGYGPQPAPGAEAQRLLWIVTPHLALPATWGNGSMLALTAPSREAVDQCHRAGLLAGGTDEGAPGLRPYGDNFYACYLRDPDGNKICAVCDAA